MSWRLLVLCLGLSLAFTAPVPAHDLAFTEVLAILKSDGTYQVDVTCHLDALALGASHHVGSQSHATSHRHDDSQSHAASHDGDGRTLTATLAALPPEALAARLKAARNTLLRRIRILFDGEAVTPRLTFPDYEVPAACEAPPPDLRTVDGSATLFGHTARFSGAIPADASTFAFRASRAFPAVRLTILDQVGLDGVRQILEPGADSAPFPLRPPTP